MPMAAVVFPLPLPVITPAIAERHRVHGPLVDDATAEVHGALLGDLSLQATREGLVALVGDELDQLGRLVGIERLLFRDTE